MNSFLFWCERHERTFFWGIIAIFICIRLLGVHSPLHQDEYKWPIITSPSYVSDINIPHPPLSELIYRTGGHIVGYNDNFRFIPLFFSVLNLALLYYYLRTKAGKRVAVIGSVIFTLSYFSILSSLMVDTDGTMLPFFFLLCLIFYEKTKSTFTEAASGSRTRERIFFLAGLAISAALGFMVKVSFVLPMIAIVLDCVWQYRAILNLKKVIRYALYLLGFVIGLGVLLLIARAIFPFFNLSASASYWIHFAHLHRNWLQTFIQVIKAVLYASPLLVCPLFFLDKKTLKESRVMLLYIAVGLVFYVLLFDFSTGALDRYMQYIVVPLSVIAAVVFDSLLERSKKMSSKVRWAYLAGFIIAVIFVGMQFLPHSVPSLNPKAAWIGRILSFKWNFVYPFSGGSGPIGFYVSFLFVALSWIASVAAALYALIQKKHGDLVKAAAFAFILVVGLVYNAVFAEEYFEGYINGSASRLLPAAVEFIKHDPAISRVIVYNDNGGYEVQATGKYERRMYADPMFVDTYTKVFSSYTGHILEINVPRIDPASIYRHYLDSCDVTYDALDRKIEAKIYACTPTASTTPEPL